MSLAKPFLIALLAALALLSSAFAAYRTGDSLLLREAVTEDLYLAGRTVDVLAPIQGDLVAAAQRLRLAAPLSGDLIAAAERLELSAPVADDARLAGRELSLRAAVGGHLVAAGAEIELTGEAGVTDWAWLAGGSLRVDGRVGSLKAAGNRVVIGGTVAGDAEIMAEEVELLPTARIDGDLRVRSHNKPRIARAESVGGRIIVTEPPAAPERPVAPGIAGMLVSVLVLLVTAGALYLLFPGYAHAASAEARAAPVKTPALGLAVLAATPVLVVVLFVTGVGFLLGLAVLALYLTALLLGLVTGLFCAADWGLRRRRPERPGRGRGLLAVTLAVLALAVLQLVPVLGGLAIFLLLLFGLGALTLRLWRAYRAPPAPEPPTGAAPVPTQP